MENETSQPQKKGNMLPISIMLGAAMISGTWIYTMGLRATDAVSVAQGDASSQETDLASAVLSSDGVALSVRWGDIGKRMVEAGVIDAEKFEAIYEARGGLTDGERALLYGGDNGELRINAQNAGILLNLLWAFGLGNKNAVLDNGPMMDERYGGAGNFASTGGWTISDGDAMNHYSRHAFVTLTDAQQQAVERVAKGIFRPCCGNSTYFPDCNHGMAMLGLLELMAAQGVSEDEMYRVALAVNSFWFPDTYLTIAAYYAKQGVAWKDVDPREALGNDFSSGAGYRRVRTLVEPPKTQQSGGGCGV